MKNNIFIDEPTIEDINEISEDINEISEDIDFSDDDFADLSYGKDYDEVKIYLRSIGKFKVLTPEEELELAKKVANGDKNARQQLINSNLRFVVFIAKRYYKYFYTTTLSILDIIQDGNIGLMTAVDKFDYTMGWRFLTYAAWWIRQTILRGIQNYSNNIRIPIHVMEQIRFIQNAREILGIKDEENKADIIRLCDFINSHPEYNIRKNNKELTKITPSMIKEYDMIKRTARTVSLNMPVEDAEGTQDTTLEDYIEDDPNTRPSAIIERNGVLEYLNSLIDKVLDPKIALIIKLRFGIGTFGRPAMTLTDIGCIVGVTRERIRQIENKGIETLHVYFKRLQRKTGIDYSEILRG